MGILKKHNAAAAEAQAPAFEGEEGTAVEQAAEVKTVTREQVAPAETKPAETKPVEAAKQPEAEKPAAVEQAPAAAEPAKTTAVIARTEGGELKTFLNNGKGMISPLKELENAFEKAGIEVDYNTFARLRVDSGHIASAEGKDAGEYIEVQVVSYGATWVLGTGTDDEESKKFVRFSSDGKTVKPAGDDDAWGGKTVEEYKEHLHTLGYEKASLKTYCVVHGIALDAQEPGFEHMNEMIALQLAPQSKDKFNAYIVNRGIAARMGRIVETSGNPVVRFTTERAKNAQGKSYFNVIPSHGKTAPVDLG